MAKDDEKEPCPHIAAPHAYFGIGAPQPDEVKNYPETVELPLSEYRDLLAVAHGSWHLCSALLACREGVGTDLIEEIRDALRAVLVSAKGRADWDKL